MGAIQDTPLSERTIQAMTPEQTDALIGLVLIVNCIIRFTLGHHWLLYACLTISNAAMAWLMASLGYPLVAFGFALGVPSTIVLGIRKLHR